MNTVEDSSLEDLVKKQLIFISKITGKDITSIEVQKSDFKGLANEFNHTLKFSLDNNYFIELIDELKYSNEWSTWSDDNQFIIKKDGENIYEERWTSTTNIHSGPIDSTTNSDLMNEVSRNIISRIGDMHVDAVPLYDYESYTFNDFQKESVYGANLYRIMFALMKDEGKLLPPMLIKEPLVDEWMQNGEVEKLDDLLLNRINSLENKYEPFVLNHMIFERENIKQYAEFRRKYLDNNTPLSKKAADISSVVIPGETYKDKINILVVEDFGDINMDNGAVEDASIGVLAEKLKIDLAKTRMYDGVTIYRSVNLSECMWLCDTGQINLIVLDGKGNKMGEAMDILNQQGASFNIKQGPQEISPELFGGSKEKEMWVRRIYESLEEKNLPKPAHIILPKNFMSIDLATLVKGVLPIKSKFSKEEDIFTEKHIRELSDVYNIEADMDLACNNNIQESPYEKSIRDNITIQKIKLKQQEMWAEGAASMGDKLSKEQFGMVLYSFINQNIPENFEDTSPSSLMEGLQRIDIIADKYKEYIKDENSLSELYSGINLRLSISEVQLSDSGYFTYRGGNALDKLGNIVANTYILLKKMNEYDAEKYLKSERDDPIETKISDYYGSNSKELIDRIISHSLAIASSLEATGGKRGSDMSKFVLKYSKKIAEVSSTVPAFDFYYKRMFE